MKKLLVVGIVFAGAGLMFWMIPRENSPREDMAAGVGFFNAASSGTVVTKRSVNEESKQVAAFALDQVQLFYPDIMTGPAGCGSVIGETPSIGLPVAADTQEGLYALVLGRLVANPDSNFRDERYRESYVTGLDVRSLDYDPLNGRLTLDIPGLGLAGHCESAAALNQVRETMTALPGVIEVMILQESTSGFGEQLPPVRSQES